jgi:hypothetical protein
MATGFWLGRLGWSSLSQRQIELVSARKQVAAVSNVATATYRVIGALGNYWGKASASGNPSTGMAGEVDHGHGLAEGGRMAEWPAAAECNARGLLPRRRSIAMARFLPLVLQLR